MIVYPAILLQAQAETPAITQAFQSFFGSEFMTVLGTWLAAGLTLIMFSFIFRDNPFFKFAEHLYLGLSAGWLMALYWHNYMKPNFLYRLFPQLSAEGEIPFDPWVIIPAILGLFIILRLFRPIAWLSRITFAFYIGGFAGVAIPKTINGFLLPQLYSTIKALEITPTSPQELLLLINGLILLVGAFTVLVYFFFSVEHKGTVGALARIGVYFLMIAFGASFGYTIMARVSLLIGRMNFLLADWLHLTSG